MFYYQRYQFPLNKESVSIPNPLSLQKGGQVYFGIEHYYLENPAQFNEINNQKRLVQSLILEKLKEEERVREKLLSEFQTYIKKILDLNLYQNKQLLLINFYALKVYALQNDSQKFYENVTELLLTYRKYNMREPLICNITHQFCSCKNHLPLCRSFL